MTNLDVTYEDLISASEQLDDIATKMTDLLTRVTTAVDGLIGDGFQTDQASAEYDTQVTTFVTNTTNGVKAMKNVAQFLPQVAEAFKTTDGGLAAGLTGGA